MQKQSINKVKLGIFVAIGVALFLAGIYYIGETKKLFSTTFRISAMFKDVNGLQVGNNVRFAGINVGTIEAIEIITDSTVKVDMILDVKTQKFIKKDAKAIIGSDGLMGNKIMNVSPGTTAFAMVENNDMIGTTIPISLDDMLLKLKNTTDNAALITDDLAAIMGNIRSGKGTIGKLFMDTVFADNLDKTIVNVKQGTKGFKQNMDAAKGSFLLRGFFNKKDKKTKKDKK
jgi:phospholipid/cholesterol/gamma-HCH transport system substrate-binding protein